LTGLVESLGKEGCAFDNVLDHVGKAISIPVAKAAAVLVIDELEKAI
jgi:hypothetical protein